MVNVNGIYGCLENLVQSKPKLIFIEIKAEANFYWTTKLSAKAIKSTLQ